MEIKSRQEIKKILTDCVDGAIARTSKNILVNKAHKPFHRALLPEEIVKISSFERSFSTSFGQGPIEKISEIIACENGYQAERQKESQLSIYKGAVDEVERICSALRAGNQNPNWKREVKTILAFDKGDTVVRRVISDLWLKKDGVETFISIKTVKPNLDQSEIAKKNMLLIKAANADNCPFFGLYYNPHGVNRQDYNHNFPMKIFNMHNDECVLIGKDYWDFVGGAGTYEALLKVFAEVGNETKKTLLGFNSR